MLTGLKVPLWWPERLARAAAAGGATPEWLPDGALVYADFKNGNYAIDGEVVTLEDMFVEDGSYAAFDPADVVEGVGYSDPRTASYNGPVLTAAALASLPSDMVEVLTFSNAKGDAVEQYLWNEWLGGGEDWAFVYKTASAGGTGVFFGDNASTASTAFAPADGDHKAALLFSTASLAVSVDGAAAISVVPANAHAGRSKKGYAWYTDGTTGTGVLEKIEVYPTSLYDAADLPTLSAP